ncbi:MAG: site-specific integrase [Acidobacteriaceae bacterium]
MHLCGQLSGQRTAPQLSAASAPTGAEARASLPFRVAPQLLGAHLHLELVEGHSESRATCRVERFSTRALRHLCLTDLARAGWDIHEIAAFAGHRSIQTTLLYIHLSGRDLSAKLAASMTQIHARRAQMLAEMNI